MPIVPYYLGRPASVWIAAMRKPKENISNGLYKC